MQHFERRLNQRCARSRWITAWGGFARGIALLVPLACSAQDAVSPLDLRLDAGWVVPVGEAVRQDDAVLVSGDATTEQAVVVWPGLGIEANRYRYLTIEHRGLAPRHALSLFVRSDTGENVIDIPETARRATLELAVGAGWKGTITEIGLVLGPEGNIATLVPAPRFELHRLRLEPPSVAAAARAALTRAAALPGWKGVSINLLSENTLVRSGGVLVLVGLLLAAGLRTPVGRRVAFGAILGGLAIAELAMWRQYAAQHRETALVATARDAEHRTRALDWEFAEIAERLKSQAAAVGADTVFTVAIDDRYAAERLRYHLLPYRTHRNEAEGRGAATVCAIALDDAEARGGQRVLATADTAFGHITATVGMEDAACSAARSP